jgi:hypothetical protein
LKRRLFFVSNSSSSSFCVLGAYLNQEEVKGLVDAIHTSKNIDGYGCSKDSWDSNVGRIWLSSNTKLDEYFDGEEDTILVGADVDNKSMPEIQKIAAELAEVLGCSVEDLKLSGWGWYEG